MGHRVRHYHKPRSQVPGTPASQGPSGTPTLVLSTAPSTPDQSGVPFTTFPIVQLQDGLGNNVAQVGVNVLVNVSPVPSVSQAITPTGGSPALTDATGKLTYTAFSLTGLAGSYVLTWTATGYNSVSATISLTAGAPNPANFTATVPSIVILNNTVTITVQARDAAGNACTAATNSVVVNINGAQTGSATVTNNNNGTYTATYVATVVGTDTVTITADGTAIIGSPFTISVRQPLVGLYPNLPGGYTMPSNFVCTFSNGTVNGALTAEGAWSPFPTSGGFVQTLRDASTYAPGAGITSPTNPAGSPNLIGEVKDYTGMTLTGIAAGGMNGPSFLGNGWRGIYLVYYVQLSSNWVSHPSGVNKIGFANINGFPMYYLTAQSAANWEIHTQDAQADPLGGQRNLTANVAAAGVTKGLWQRVEVQLVANTPGVANGIARAWLTNYNSNGQPVSSPVHTHEYTNVGWVNSSGSPFWTFCNWSPIYGGNTSGTLAANQYMWMDHIALAGSA